MKIKKLDTIRGFAAFYVVMHHLLGFTVLGPMLGPIVHFPFRFGQEAVILFFLLSGFVIYLSSIKESNLEFRSYFVKRFRRIYPIVIFSLLLSFLVAKLNGTILKSQDYISLFGNLLMLQDIDNKPGTWFTTFLDNFPLWSLSYEWWFYLMFFPLYKLLPKNQFRIYWILSISVIAWFTYLVVPNHLSLVLSYLILWWVGLESGVIFVRDKKFTLKSTRHIFLCLLTMVLVSAIPVIAVVVNPSAAGHSLVPILYPMVTFRHFLFALIAMIVGLVWWKFNLFYFDAILNPFYHLALISYAIYLLHFPLIQLNLSLWVPNALAAIALKLIILVGLSFWLEQRLQPFINKLIK